MPRSRTQRRRRAAAGGLVAAALAAQSALAGALTVTVVDRENRPVPNVAVVVTPRDPAAPLPAPPPEPAVMNQIDREFRPHVLVVQTGSRVRFPNDDDVNHHVYSFSSPKSFELQLYKGSPHAPLDFARPGLVVLGCNIHDDMLGYILVVDTPWFAKTDADGVARFEDLPETEPLSVRAWTPRLKPDALPGEQRVTLEGERPATLAFAIRQRLLPARESQDTSLTWADY